MKRWTVLATLVVTGALSLTVAAFQQPAGTQERVVTVEKVKDNLYVLRGGGGNTAVFITANGVTVVDTKNPGWGQPLLDKIKTLTDKPVTTIINTHTHGDHVSGNVEFPATVDIVAHVNTKTHMESPQPVTGLQTTAPPNIFKEHGGQGLPKRTFTDRLVIGNGADRIELHYFGRAHTDGDAWVVFPALRVMHAGDAFPNKNLPIMDTNNGGSAMEYAATLRKAASGVSNVDIIVNGHTPANTTPADLKEYASFVADFVVAAQDAKKAGKTVDQFTAEWKVPAKYAGYDAQQAATVKARAQLVYDGK